MISTSEAKALIGLKTGYALDERTGCWIVDAHLRAPSGMGPYLSFYTAEFGEPPDGFDVFHRCPGGLRGCVRPSHLDVQPIGLRAPLPPDPGLDWESRSSFRRRIRDEREARRMNRPDFARELRVAARTLKAWEEGTRAPTRDTYERLARHLGWDGRARKWAVVFVHEEVVTATSSGEAMRMVWDALEREDRPRKTVVFGVRPATK